ncbi:MAG: hypothetical protein JO192_04555 [Candidatus Eremiobacteraeota bacterium]|nr:hypothetical protein [Candidatus Eremiobacteraeota bacterium]MBV8331985.1 hypothetical protein [Candidatus Eremiobacteraeota bacterium]MBV8721064.1 hypothetical protein [Candidatus Eremiobacteraeota bacterium]
MARYLFLLLVTIAITLPRVAFADVDATVEVAPQPAPSSPWSWPVIPTCIAEHPQKPQPTPTEPPPVEVAAGAASICDLFASLTKPNPYVTVIEVLPAAVVNGHDPYDDDFPAFQPGSLVVHFRVAGDIRKIFSGVNHLERAASSAASARLGKWWTTFAQVSADGKTLRDVREISDVLALPAMPSCAATGMDAGTGHDAYFGMVAKGFSQEGGGIELFFPNGGVNAQADVAQIPGAATCANALPDGQIPQDPLNPLPE